MLMDIALSKKLPLRSERVSFCVDESCLAKPNPVRACGLQGIVYEQEKLGQFCCRVKAKKVFATGDT